MPMAGYVREKNGGSKAENKLLQSFFFPVGVMTLFHRSEQCLCMDLQRSLVLWAQKHPAQCGTAGVTQPWAQLHDGALHSQRAAVGSCPQL